MNYFNLPFQDWTNQFINQWLIPTFRPLFDSISTNIGIVLAAFESFLLWIRPELLALIILVIVWRTAGKGTTLFALIGILFLGAVNLWEESMQTLAIVLSATFFSILFGIPIGILSAKSNLVDRIVRPILDFMQTLPSFVYLIPAVLLLGIGAVPAVLATFIFATPPAVRLTNLGIRQVPEEVVEAARAFGSTSWQMLRKVQLPLALPTIMAGINQTIMLSLSMAVIASMIGSPGLGSVVMSGISRVDAGIGFAGGLGIVILAIILDRVTASIGRKNDQVNK